MNKEIKEKYIEIYKKCLISGSACDTADLKCSSCNYGEILINLEKQLNINEIKELRMIVGDN